MRSLVALTIFIFLTTGCDVLIGDRPCCGPATTTPSPALSLRETRAALPPRIGEPTGAPTEMPVVKPPTATPGQKPGANATPPSKPGANVSPQPIPAGAANTYWVTNPTSGARLFVQVFAPKNASKSPALVLVPGGTGDSGGMLDDALRMASAGIVAVIFDPDGRGKSTGTEDYDGYKQQDGLAALVRFVSTLAEVDAKQIGIATYSYGITMGSGVLARYPDLPVKFLIDWEGPADRNYTTTGCRDVGSGHIKWQPCSDNAWWSEREAVNFVGKIRVPYQRIQSEKDHVQPNNNHAIDMINAAIKGGVPWTRLNSLAPNQTYDVKNSPALLPESMDRQLAQTVIQHAQELFKK